MFNRVFLSLALLLFSLNASAQLFEEKNKFGDAVAEPEFLKVDEAFQFSSEQTNEGIKLHWEIADDYYLYKERFKFKTKSEGVSIGDAQFSTNGKAKQDPYFGEVHVIHNELAIFLPVTLSPDTSDGEVRITYQGCAEAGLCYPPKHQTILFFPSAAASEVNSAAASETENTPTAPSAMSAPSTSVDTSDLSDANSVSSFIEDSSLLSIFFIFLLLGLGLTFTPCVFPMIPIITSIIAGQEKPTVSKSFMLAIAYVLGMALTYAAAGVITGMLGAGANVQAALQSPPLIAVFASIFVLLSLAMFGFYELQLPAFIRDRLNASSQRLSGGYLTSVFMIGALSALVVSPCVSAPLAGALLYISSTGDAVIGGLSLFALGLGMGIPLIIIAVGGGKWLPKAGKWMDAVKAVFGVMLLAVAVWLVSRVVPGEITMILWAVLFGVSAIQMGAFESAQYGWQRLWKALGLMLALYAALLIIGVSQGNTNPLQPLSGFANQTLSTTTSTSNKLAFETIYDNTQLEQLLKDNRNQPVMLDFYADWCISCKVMENQVFPLPDIASKMSQFRLVKADVTDNDAGNKALLNQFGLFGPPSILFFDETGKEIREARIVGEISAQGFSKRLSDALSSNTSPGV